MDPAEEVCWIQCLLTHCFEPREKKATLVPTEPSKASGGGAPSDGGLNADEREYRDEGIHSQNARIQ